MNKNISDAIRQAIRNDGDDTQRNILMRFFKTGKGEYGEGDMFHGVRVPRVRELVKEYKGVADTDDVRALAESPYHEERLAGLLLLIELYRKAKNARKARKAEYNSETKVLVNLYLSLIDRGNNWDLVDMVAPKILGDWLVDNPEERHLLFELAGMDGFLWHQRVAMVSTWTLIRAGSFTEALELARIFINHKHDLMHKASGWMLREVGKRGGYEQLLMFLDRYAHIMPRTMLRYSLEKLPPDRKEYYMRAKSHLNNTGVE